MAGAALGVIVVGAALLSPWALAVVAAAVVVVGQDELFRMASSREGVRPMGTLAMCIGVALVAESVLEPSPVVLLTLLLFVPLLFAAELSRGSQRSLENMAITTFGLLDTAVPMALMMMVGFVGKEWEPARVLAIIFIVWINDIFAYIVGITMGRHRLFERISPKKSWEGFFGGLLFATAAAVAVGAMLGESLLLWGGVGVVVVVAAVLGDLVESMFKRSVGVKDSGALIPGHGGMLDRFDALLFAAPCVLFYLTIVTL